MSWDTIVLLMAAGFGAGLANGVAGGGSLVSFPALIAAGHTALVANVTSTVGIWPGYAGGAAGYRRVLAAQRARAVALGTHVRRRRPRGRGSAAVDAELVLREPRAVPDPGRLCVVRRPARAVASAQPARRGASHWRRAHAVVGAVARVRLRRRGVRRLLRRRPRRDPPRGAGAAVGRGDPAGERAPRRPRAC